VVVVCANTGSGGERFGCLAEAEVEDDAIGTQGSRAGGE